MTGHVFNNVSPNQVLTSTTSNVMTSANTSTVSSAVTSTAESASQVSQNSVSSGQTLLSGQTSQARGNTQTNLTTSTHTRSTARPHVRLSQHAAMQGFDPFLPCNSHHITSRRRIQTPRPSQQQSSQSGVGNRQEGTTATGTQGQTGVGVGGEPNNQLYHMLQGMIRSIANRRNSIRVQQNATASASTMTASTAVSSSSQTQLTSDPTNQGTLRNPYLQMLQEVVSTIIYYK